MKKKQNKKECKCEEYGHIALRVIIGLIFLIPGISKLMDPSGITGMLEGLGFPAASAIAWLLLLTEIIFGAALILGFRLKYTVWPLVAILIVAIAAVHIPNAQGAMGWVNVLWHALGIAVLLELYVMGPGAWFLGKKE